MRQLASYPNGFSLLPKSVSVLFSVGCVFPGVSLTHVFENYAYALNKRKL